MTRLRRAVLLDIEGTTTPIAFVHNQLFPYARAQLRSYLESRISDSDLAQIRRLLNQEHQYDCARGEPVPSISGSEHDRTRLVAYLEWLMDRDRKSPGLKLLQGLIWERGYRAGAIHGEVYEDVSDALRRWKEAGLTIAIYSSGSELAQRLLFESTKYGDLTPLIAAFFDTGVGAKTSADSYRAIAKALDVAERDIVFISDVTTELRAAKSAGMQVLLSVRPGNRPQPDRDDFETIETFESL